MAVLVLGGSGFIGSYVVDALREEGHEVTVLGRRPEPFRHPQAGVKYITGEFSNKNAILEALKDTTAVVHLISSTIPSTSNIDPVLDINENLISTVNLLQLMRDCNVNKLIFLSSGGTIYGVPEKLPVVESHKLKPICSYGIVKAAIEHYIEMEHFLHGLNYVILRVSNPYGPRQARVGVQGLINTLLWNTVRCQSTKIWGDGNSSRDYVYVEDVAQACVSALASSHCGTYNVGSGKGQTVNEIIEVVGEITKKKPSIERLPARGFDVPRIVLDCTAAARILKWQAATPITAGIHETWEWMKDREEK